MQCIWSVDPCCAIIARNEWEADHESYERKMQNITNSAAETEAELKQQVRDIEDQFKKTT